MTATTASIRRGRQAAVAILAAACLWSSGVAAAAGPDLNRGRTAAVRGDWESALGFFEQAFAEAPDDPEVLHAVATAHEWLRQPVPSIVFYRAYLEARPGAADRQQIEARIVEQEVFLDRLTRDLFREAVGTAATVAETMATQADRTALWARIARQLAEAGEPALLREVALSRPRGVPAALAFAATAATSDFYGSGRVPNAAAPVDLLDIADAALEAEADALAVAPPASDDALQGYFAAWCTALTYARCIEAMQRDYRREAPARRAYHQGVGQISLAAFARAIGLGARAFRLWQAGSRQLAGNAVLRRSGCVTWSNRECVLEGDRMAVVGVAGEPAFAADAADDPPRIRPMRGTRWSDLARNGRAEYDYPMAFALAEPAYRHLRSLVEAAQRRPVDTIPAALADLAATLARARLFLRINDPALGTR